MATALAQDYLAADGATGQITVEANTVTVTVSRTVDYVFRPGTATVTSTSAVEAATQGATP